MVRTKIGTFQCECCGFRNSLSAFDYQYGDHYCPECGDSAVKFTGVERDAEWYSVAAYAVSREYGGPEEGGWYYDSGTVIPETLRGYPADNFGDAEAYQLYLQAKYADMRDVQVRVNAEKHVMRFPSQKPQYC